MPRWPKDRKPPKRETKRRLRKEREETQPLQTTAGEEASPGMTALTTRAPYVQYLIEIRNGGLYGSDVEYLSQGYSGPVEQLMINIKAARPGKSIRITRITHHNVLTHDEGI